MKIGELTNNQLIKDLQLKVAKIESKKAEIEQELKRLQSMLDILLPDSSKTKNGSGSAITLKAKVLNVLKEANQFLTANELRDKVNIKYPEKPYDTGRFSGQFSFIYNKLGIKRHIEKDAPIQLRYYYGFESWFEKDGTPNKVYLQNTKIQERKI